MSQDQNDIYIYFIRMIFHAPLKSQDGVFTIEWLKAGVIAQKAL